jgi:hypothetical protein
MAADTASHREVDVLGFPLPATLSAQQQEARRAAAEKQDKYAERWRKWVPGGADGEGPLHATRSELKKPIRKVR